MFLVQMKLNGLKIVKRCFMSSFPADKGGPKSEQENTGRIKAMISETKIGNIFLKGGGGEQ